MKSQTVALLLTAFAILQNLPETKSVATLQVQSFGRIAPIGGLYDARTVSFLPGSSIFQPTFRIPASAFQTKQVSASQLHVHPLDSTFSKFNEEDFSRATILSILSEQLQVHGSWRYLVEEPKGQSVRYKTELRRKWKREYDLELIRDEDVHAHMRGELIAMPHSVVHHFSPEQLLAPQNVNATHFIVGVSYGKSVTAIFEDPYALRKYGMSSENDATHQQEEVLAPTNASARTHKIVRLYTERPLHPGAGVDTLAELEQHFFEFDHADMSDTSPLLYTLIPLSSILTYLNVNETVMAQLANRWSPQFYIGDPYIEPLTMVPIYQEFDAISIVQFRLNEAVELLRDPEFEHLVRSRRQYLQKINDLQNKFGYALGRFKHHLQKILTSYRLGKFSGGWTFEQALDDTLDTYKSGPYSVENVTKILDTQFQGLHVAICLEKVERTLGNLYGQGVDKHLKALDRIAYRF